MKVGSIDIGTNTTRLAIAESNPFKIIKKYRKITRLGENFNGSLYENARKRVIETLKEYKKVLDDFNVSSYRGVATSVVREAENGKDFIDEIYKKTELKIDIIDGKEEAELTFKGVISVLDNGIKNFLLLDIGGGSNEFSVSLNREFINSISLKFGVVFLHEKFIKNNPPKMEEIEAMEENILKNLKNVNNQLKLSNNLNFVGTAGTITTLAAIHRGLKEYFPEEINNHHIPYDFLNSLIDKMLPMTISMREKTFFIEKGRGDVIIPGLLIVKKTMEYFNFNEIISIDSSLLEGVAYSLIDEE